MNTKRNTTLFLCRKIALALAFFVLFSSFGFPFSGTRENSHSQTNAKIFFNSPEKSSVPLELFILNFYEEEDTEDDSGLEFSNSVFTNNTVELFVSDLGNRNKIVSRTDFINVVSILMLTQNLRI